MARAIGLRGFRLTGKRDCACHLARLGIDGCGIVAARIEDEDAFRQRIVQEPIGSISGWQIYFVDGFERL